MEKNLGSEKLLNMFEKYHGLRKPSPFLVTFADVRKRQSYGLTFDPSPARMRAIRWG